MKLFKLDYNTTINLEMIIEIDHENKRLFMESVIKWETGTPKESGAYLVTIKGRYSIFVQYAQFGCLTGWSYFKPEEILAWCKLSDIEPYTEETK